MGTDGKIFRCGQKLQNNKKRKAGRIVGIIFGSARYENIIAVDIEVEETYRRRGIAAFLTEHMLSSWSEENLTVQWDCVESNTASRMAA